MAAANVQRRGIWLTVVSVVVVAGLLVGTFIYSMAHRTPSLEALRESGVFLFRNPRKLPAFTLVDDSGNEIRPEDFRGRWSLVFFGFTHCPDICPTTMAQLSRFYEALDAQLQSDTQVFLTSVDPARDTVEKLHQYVGYFHDDFRGITGEFLDIHRFATGLNIPFSKVPGGGENYQVEHSGNVAIINPQGHYVGYFRAPIEVDVLKQYYPIVRDMRS